MVNGIILVIIPLLALTNADQMANIMNALQIDGLIEAHNLDGTSRSALRDIIIPRMDEIQYDTSSTMFLLSSPQYFVDNPLFLQAVLRCYRQRTLRLVSVDEAHLYAMHGRSFRVAMRILQRLLFNVIFAIGVWHPLLLAMTATMTDSLVASFSTLTSVQRDASCGDNPWDSKRCLILSDTTAFHQRYI